MSTACGSFCQQCKAALDELTAAAYRAKKRRAERLLRVVRRQQEPNARRQIEVYRRALRAAREVAT
jgi:hypothetical protein